MEIALIVMMILSSKYIEVKFQTFYFLILILHQFRCKLNLDYLMKQKIKLLIIKDSRRMKSLYYLNNINSIYYREQ